MKSLNDLVTGLSKCVSTLTGTRTDNDTNRTDKVRFEEWKECQTTIGRFDQIIFDLRKYGFSLVTILMGASGFLYSNVAMTTGGILGVYVALLLLIGALFTIDRYHEVFLRAAVKCAEDIEHDLGMNLTRTISIHSKHAKCDTWGIGVYTLFCVANYFLVLGAKLDLSTRDALIVSVEKNQLFIVIATLFIVITAVAFYYYHRSRQFS